jgi:cytidylate kinase
VIAVDGPGGSGKSTVARGVAAELGLSYLDTGAMYRAVTWLALHRGIDLQAADADAQLTTLAEQATLHLAADPAGRKVVIDGNDVTAGIRERPVTNAVSRVAAAPGVRALLVERQRQIIHEALGGIVVEGRDIGTVVAPDAPVKIFLTADDAVRAERRARELGQDAPEAVARTREELNRRDTLDSGRADSPLTQAPDAVVVDTSTLTVEQVIEAVTARCRSVLGDRVTGLSTDGSLPAGGRSR